MADPRRLKHKGGDSKPPAHIYELQAHDPLYFMSSHDNPWLCDLHIFETGFSEATTTNSVRTNSGPSFTGRPRLILELAPAIYRQYHLSPASTGTSVEGSLRWWWRFLDSINDILPVESIEDFTELHYAHYRHLGAKLPPPNTASIFFSLLDHARAILNESKHENEKLIRLEWTAVYKPSPERAVILFDDVKRIYEHLKHLCFPAVRRYESDIEAMPTRMEISALFTLFILQSGWNVSTALNVNVEDKDADGNLNCIRPNPLNPSMSVIKSFGSIEHGDDDENDFESDSSTVVAPKPRAGGVIQRAHSRNKQSLSPGNIIIILARNTESLRRKLKLYRAQLAVQVETLRVSGIAGRSVDELVKEIKDLTREINSPWLYATSETNGGNRRRKGTVAEGIGFRGKDSQSIKIYPKSINARLSASEKPIPENICLRDLRDSFIAWRWMTSHSWLDAMLAAGHSSRHSLIRYLKRKQIKASHRIQFLKVGNALWDTVVQLRVVPGAPALNSIIAAKVAGATDEQIKRWCEGKDQTYVGTGCVDFYHPPANISPTHVEGTGCRIQRCMLCPHALLLKNSADHLARRTAELRHGRKTMPEAAWQEGDYGQELLNTEDALKEFSQDEVGLLLSKWETAIQDGTHRSILMEGAYA